MTKTEARKLAKACRAAVDLHTVGHAMAGVLFALPAWQHADTVLAFASMPVYVSGCCRKCTIPPTDRGSRSRMRLPNS